MSLFIEEAQLDKHVCLSFPGVLNRWNLHDWQFFIALQQNNEENESMIMK